MKPREIINIAVADTSIIVRSGLVSVLKHITDFEIHPLEITSREGLQHCMESHIPDILIINPLFEGWFDTDTFRQTYKGKDIKIVSIICTVVDSSQIRGYDESITLFDDTEVIVKKISEMMNFGHEDEDQESLSLREKEIVGCIVKGMTNKEIADKLFISVHTVMTHRKNITRKLQVHSAAGLTIYAIVNKLVELSEVKMEM